MSLKIANKIEWYILGMYFDNLDEFESWKTHVGVLTSCFGLNNSKINKAIEIVEEYHNQARIIGEGNYNRHPLRVARILIEEMKIIDENSVLIALCHDLGEWSDYDVRQLNEEFGGRVFQGVNVLTWNQEGEWAAFVAKIVESNIENLLTIKIADKLDNNRAIALSGDSEDKLKAKNKTIKTILPLVEKYYPSMLNAYREVLICLG